MMKYYSIGTVFITFDSSLDQSLNIFENLNIEDASLEGYIRRHSNNSFDSTTNEKNLHAGTFLEELENSDDATKTIKQLEELLTAKEALIGALTGELESAKDVASNNSTLSCPTSTEYKQYQEECQNKVHFLIETCLDVILLDKSKILIKADSLYLNTHDDLSCFKRYQN